MPEYLSPGVYVEEVPSAIKPIAGVSTSTASFVGVVPDKITILEENPDYDPTQPPTAAEGKNSPTISWTFPLDKTKDWQPAKDALDKASLPNSRPLQAAPGVSPSDFRRARENFALAQSRLAAGTMAPVGEPVLCTSFSDFTRNFGSFSTDGLPPATPAGTAAPAAPAAPPTSFQNRLAHAVYGFFQNGGMRCYVMRYASVADLQDPLKWLPLETVDEISIVAAPGVDDPSGIVQSNLIDHCEQLADRFAIVDAPPDPDQLTVSAIKVPDRNTVYGGLYFPYLRIFDMQTKLLQPDSDGVIAIPPSGHLAGIYSRVDHERGVHKAPANEVVRGAVDVGHQVSRSAQDGLNPYGINCIRFINDAVTVWGARTIGGDTNTDLKYINVRRTLIFLRKSIDQGTQWAVFEPNDRSLWAKLVRNVSAFLTTVWRDGALFGSTTAEAFYVKCDDETNPPENRDLGQVTVEIGVAIVRPAEFVIFRISQFSAPTAG
jgi:phage tail sheath protein FI